MGFARLSFMAGLWNPGETIRREAQPLAGSAADYEPMLARAIGVIYRPETERASHYFEAHLPAQFDAVIHLDSTTAIQPLETTGRATAAEPPETYPTGM